MEFNAIGGMPQADALRLGPGELAFIGDAVFELFVRREIVTSSPRKVSALHNKTVSLVCAQGQAKMAAPLLALLDENETGVYMRGRNMKHQKIPSGCSLSEYSSATALECVFGFLFLTGRLERLNFLYKSIRLPAPD